MHYLASVSDAHAVLLPFAFQLVHLRPRPGFFKNKLPFKVGSPKEFGWTAKLFFPVMIAGSDTT